MSLTVALRDGGIVRHVRARGITFSRTAPGGDEQASCTVAHRDGEMAGIGVSDQLLIMDTETGRVVWAGYTENPELGRYESRLVAQGCQVLTSDRVDPVIYRDSPLALAQWQTVDQTYANSSLSDTDGTLRMVIAPGAPIAAGQGISAHYEPGRLTGQRIRSASASASSPTPEQPGWRHRFAPVRDGVRDNADSTWAVLGTGTGASAGVLSVSYTPAPAGNTMTGLAWSVYRGAGATNVAVDTIWSQLASVDVTLETLTPTGAVATLTGPLTLRQVLDDVIGRWLSATVALGNVDAALDAAAPALLGWPEGVTARGVLDALADLLPGCTWMMRPTSGVGSARHILDFTAWGTTPRYEIPTYRSTGAAYDRCNRLRVSWTDAAGQRQTKVYTAPVPELDAVGRVRDAEAIELSDGVGTVAMADAVAAATFARINAASLAGSASVSEVRDLGTGSQLAPWAVRPGSLVRVRDTGAVLRLTRTEYSTDTGMVEMALGDPA